MRCNIYTRSQKAHRMSEEPNQENAAMPAEPLSESESTANSIDQNAGTPATEKNGNMEVHHHTHHAHHTRNWKSYFWEFLMLFLAVTLGFFVENQREHYIEYLRAKEFSKSLVQDLQNDVVAIRNHKKTVSTYIAVADSLIRLSQTQLEGRNAARFSYYTRFAYWTAPIVWNRSTFEQIKNSGSLRYFKNQQLLEKMMKYNMMIDDIESEAYNRQVRGNLLVNQINKIIDPVYHQRLSQYYIYEMDTLSNTTIESLFPTNPESLESNRSEVKEMLNMVVVQQRNLKRDLSTRLKQADEMANELINDLKEEYGN